MSAEAHHAFTLSAEWLLDNAYLIREQVADLRKSLPQKYYGKLPLIASGPRCGTAPGLSCCRGNGRRGPDGALSPEIIPEVFGRVSSDDHAPGYRRTLGFSADVAIAVARMSSHARDPSRPTATGKRRGQVLGKPAYHRRPAQFTAIAQNSGTTRGKVSGADAAAFCERNSVAHLYDDEGALPVVSGWLERSLRSPLLEVMQQEHRHQAATTDRPYECDQ